MCCLIAGHRYKRPPPMFNSFPNRWFRSRKSWRTTFVTSTPWSSRLSGGGTSRNLLCSGCGRTMMEFDMKPVKINGVAVGPGYPPYIIAEVGSNHNGDMNLCRRLIDAAAAASAHAVKFQSWTDTSLIAEEEYARNTEYSDKKKHFGSLREMVTAYQLTADQHLEAHAHCRARGIAFCSTPFSMEEVDLLEKLAVPFFKIASMDVVHLPLLKYVA